MNLSDYPHIKAAIEKDGAIRVIDGRYSAGFVEREELLSCVAVGILEVEMRGGMAFAVLPRRGKDGAK